MVLVMRFGDVDGPFCRDCGTRAFRDTTSHTLIAGWWGWISFVIAPFTVLANLIAVRKLRGLTTPIPNPERRIPPLDPGKPLLKRWTTLGALVPVVAVAVLAVMFVTSAKASAPHTCVSINNDRTVAFVSCSGAHDAEVLDTVTDPDRCPAIADHIFELTDEQGRNVDDGKFYCARDTPSKSYVG